MERQGARTAASRLPQSWLDEDVGPVLSSAERTLYKNWEARVDFQHWWRRNFLDHAQRPSWLLSNWPLTGQIINYWNIGAILVNESSQIWRACHDWSNLDHCNDKIGWFTARVARLAANQWFLNIAQLLPIPLKPVIHSPGLREQGAFADRVASRCKPSPLQELSGNNSRTERQPEELIYLSIA